MRTPTMMWPVKGRKNTPAEIQQQRIFSSDYIRTQATTNVPNPPADLQAQSAPRGVFVTWTLPNQGADEITGWTIYSPDERTKVGSIEGKGTEDIYRCCYGRLVASAGQYLHSLSQCPWRGICTCISARKGSSRSGSAVPAVTACRLLIGRGK